MLNRYTSAASQQYGGLIRENDVNTGITKLYSYDAGGNFIDWKSYLYTTDSIQESDEPEYTHEFFYDNYWKDQLTAIKVTIGDETGTDSVVYDEIGNPTYCLFWSMEWTGRDLTNLDGETYTYNSDGLRTSKTILNGEKTDFYYSATNSCLSIEI